MAKRKKPKPAEAEKPELTDMHGNPITDARLEAYRRFKEKWAKANRAATRFLRGHYLKLGPTEAEERERELQFLVSVATRIPKVVRGRRDPLAPAFDDYDPMEDDALNGASVSDHIHSDPSVERRPEHHDYDLEWERRIRESFCK